MVLNQIYCPLSTGHFANFVRRFGNIFHFVLTEPIVIITRISVCATYTMTTIGYVKNNTKCVAKSKQKRDMHFEANKSGLSAWSKLLSCM